MDVNALLRGLLSRRRGWVGFDVAPGLLCTAKVAAAGQGGTRPKVERCAAADAQQFAVSSLSQLARKAAAGSYPWSVVLPRGGYKLVVVPSPAVKDTEMEESIRWAAGPLLDFSVEDAELDWLPIPTAVHGSQRQEHVYAIAAPKEAIGGYADAFRQVRLPLGAVDIRETAQRNIASLAAVAGEGVMMVFASEQGVEITVTYEGDLFLDRFIELPLATLLASTADARARLLERIVLQVQRSLDFVRRTLAFIPIKRILVAPEPAPIGLREELAKNVDEQVSQLDLGSVFDFSATPELAATEAQARYFVALGAALRDWKAPA